MAESKTEPGKRRESITAVKLSNVSKDGFAAFMNSIDAVIFDCDGVLWIEMQPQFNAAALVTKLRSMEKKIFFLTNNGTRTRESLLGKFHTLGFDSTIDEVLCTSYLAALYLKELEFQKKVYALGMPGLIQELDKVGIESLPIGPDNVPPTMDRWSAQEFENVKLDPDVGAVIVSTDYGISYLKILKAASYIANRKCLFIATDADEQFPSQNKSLTLAGTGSMVSAIETASGHKSLVMGKPESFAFDLISKRYNLQPSRVLMIGDKGNTDIKFGVKCGLWTLLVLSGVTSLDDMHGWEESDDPEDKLCVPDYYIEDANELYKLISQM